MFTAEIETDQAYLAMDTLRDAMCAKGMDATNLVQDQTRLLDRTIVNFVPPIKSKWGNPKASGEGAINVELKSLFSEAEPKTIDEIGSLHGVRNVDTWMSKPGGERLHIVWENLDPEATRLDEYHRQYQDNRGKVKRQKASPIGTWRARVVVPQGSRAPFIKAQQAKVGRAKCSMSLVGQRLGDKYPSWIYRHNDHALNSGTGIVNINESNPAAPSILFGSRAPGIGRIRARVQSAVSFRAKVMVRRAKLILNDYKDWKTVRSKANARKGKPSETPEVVE